MILVVNVIDMAITYFTDNAECWRKKNITSQSCTKMLVIVFLFQPI